MDNEELIVEGEISVEQLQKKDQTVCQIFPIARMMARPQKPQRFP